MARLKLAVFLTGSGTTLENLFEHCAAGKLDADIVCVVSSRADAYGLERARKRNVPALLVERKSFADPESFSNAIFNAIAPFKPDAIALAGFMSLLCIPPAFHGKVLNIHPSLLPEFGGKGFYGHKVHAAVLKAGRKVTGCTAHFVDSQYDQGPIILQKSVAVEPADTVESLAERVQAAEREIFPQALQLFAEGRLKIEGRTVRILTK